MRMLRENPTITFGLLLPLFLVGVFAIAARFTAVVVPPPQYEVLFATNYYSTPDGGIRIEVKDGKAQVSRIGTQTVLSPRLFRYNPTTRIVQEIHFPVLVPSTAKEQNAPLVVEPIEIPDLASLTLSPQSVSPDGYIFSEISSPRRAGFFLTDIFFRDSIYEPSLIKGTYRHRIKGQANFGFYGARFIGWVIQ